MSEPIVEDVPDARRYELRIDDEVLGVVTYVDRDGARDLQHTEIEPGHEGEGLGGRLASGVLDDARARGLRIVPSCPFIAGYLDKHPEHGDLVA